jgi:hypothetical protein
MVDAAVIRQAKLRMDRVKFMVSYRGWLQKPEV